MSGENQKLTASQRQQLMASVQQQLAVQNAQELLQVTKDFNQQEKKMYIICFKKEIIRQMFHRMCQ